MILFANEQFAHLYQHVARVISDMTPTVKLWDERNLPRLGMGCWAIGGPFYAGTDPLGYGGADDRQALNAIKCALDLGIRFFDTADVYGAGHSETLLGRTIGNRDDVVISTKFGVRFDPESKQILGAETSPSYARQCVEASLRRLRRDRLDLVLLHLNSCSIEEAGGIFDILDSLVKDGKVGAYGWSTDFPERATAYAERANFVAVQHALNVFFEAPSMMPVLEHHDLISINRSPLAMGVLTGKFKSNATIPKDDIRSNTYDWMGYFKDEKIVPAYLERLDRVKNLLQTDGRTLAQGALAWIWARSPLSLPIPGFRNHAQVKDNIGALDKGPLPLDVVAAIERVIDRPPEGEARER